MIHNVMFASVTFPTNHYLFNGLIEGVKNNVVRGAQDLLQSFFWDILSGLLGMVNSLLNSIVNGVIGLDLFSNNEFLSTAFKCSLALMFLAIPAKIMWEIISAMIRDDDDAGMDIHKKLGSTALGIAIACSLTVGITQIINPVMKDASQAILNVNLTNEIQSSTATSQLGDSLIESVLISFGGLPKDGDYGASKFVKQYNKNELKITKRDGDNYVWDFSIFMSIVGMCVYVVMLFIICIQIATRVIAIGFYYVIGPLACTSMTNYQNPQAFNVWKATIIGAWAQNLTQIFLLSLFVGLLESISSATSTMPVAAVALYFGAFSLIMTAPSFVQAMIGGYASGIMDVLNQFRGGFGMAKSLVTGAVGSMIGRSNPHTGHLEGGLRGKVLGDVNGQGNRVGGARGAIFGNPDSNGNRTGGIKGAALGNSMNMGGVTGRQGGIRGAIFGNDQIASGVGGSIERTRAGGMANIGGKKRTDSFNSAGQKTGSMQKRRLSAFRGSDTTAYNPETGAQIGDSVHQRGPVPMFLNDIGNRFSGGSSDQSGGGGSDTSTRNNIGGAQSSGLKPQSQGQRPSSSTKPAVRSSGTNGNTTSHTQKTGGSNGPHTFKMKSSGEIRSSLGNRENNSGGKK